MFLTLSDIPLLTACLAGELQTLPVTGLADLHLPEAGLWSVSDLL